MNEALLSAIWMIAFQLFFGLLGLYGVWKLVMFLGPRIIPTIRGIIWNQTIWARVISIYKFSLGITLSALVIVLCMFSCRTILIRVPNDIKNTFQTSALNKKHYGLGKEYIELAAQKGDPEALFLLGDMYQKGIGCEINAKKALEYYHTAAEKGYREAQALLGSIYIEGKTIQQDIAKGLHYLELAANQNCDQASLALGLIYESGQYIAKDLAKAKQYYTAVAQHNNPTGWYQLGLLQGNENNYLAAKNSFEEAIKQGDDAARTELGIIYLYGMGIPKDFAKAKELFEVAAQKENKEALNCLGIMYMDGKGVPQDYAQSRIYFERAVKLGEPNAFISLSLFYIAGVGVKQDMDKAKNYLKVVALQSEEAKNILQNIENPKTEKLMIQKVKATFQ